VARLKASRLRSLVIRASFGEARRSAFGAKAAPSFDQWGPPVQADPRDPAEAGHYVLSDGDFIRDSRGTCRVR